ncbi:3971_t:CDS:2, partial [Funneliformis geosporum]
MNLKKEKGIEILNQISKLLKILERKRTQITEEKKAEKIDRLLKECDELLDKINVGQGSFNLHGREGLARPSSPCIYLPIGVLITMTIGFQFIERITKDKFIKEIEENIQDWTIQEIKFDELEPPLTESQKRYSAYLEGVEIKHKSVEKLRDEKVKLEQEVKRLEALINKANNQNDKPTLEVELAW